MAYVDAAGGRSWKNAVSNTAMCGKSGSALRATPIPSTAGGLCSGASGDSSSNFATSPSSISVGSYRSGPAVHHPVPDRDKPRARVVSGRRQLLEHCLQCRGVVGNLSFADALDDPVGHHVTRIRLDDRIFHRRRSRVEHQDANVS